MEPAPPAIEKPLSAAPRRLRLWRGGPYLSTGWRLGLGLAAVAAVLVASEILATRTTREALEAVQVMQNEHEPLASSANAVLEKLGLPWHKLICEGENYVERTLEAACREWYLHRILAGQHIAWTEEEKDAAQFAPHYDD